MKEEEEINVGDKILYHHLIKRVNKLAADFNASGVIVERRFGSVIIRLTDGRTSSLKNVRRLF